MKIKIKDFNGIFTNNDENDNRLELVTESENFLHKRGFLELDPRYLVEDSNLPNPNGDFPVFTWTWETGIYTTLSSDILSTRDVPSPGKHDVLVLIAKTLDSGMYHRLIYMYDITNSDGWFEMSKEGNYINSGGIPVIDIINHEDSVFDRSVFSTSIDGDAHFQVEDGRLKIYLPHDTFWLGKIDRKIWARDDKHRWPHDDGSGVITYPSFDYEENWWYIDRITDQWDHKKQNVMILDQDLISQVPYAPWNETGGTTVAKGAPESGTNRRLGIIYDMQVNDSQTYVINHKEITIGNPHDNTVRQENNRANFRCVRCTVTDELGFGVKAPVEWISGEPFIWLFVLDATKTDAALPALNDPGDVVDWPIPQPIPANFANIFIFLPLGTQEGAWALTSEAAWSTLGSYTSYNSGDGRLWNGADPQAVNEATWSISLEDLLGNDISYGGDQTPADIGWETGENQFSIAVTAVLDEREEILMGVYNYHPEPTGKYVLDIKNVQLPWDFNKRMTRVRFYHQLKDEVQYEMIKDFDLLASDGTIENFSISTDDYDANYFAANTGFLLDFYDHPADYRLINGWKDFVTESGISIGISTRDEVAVYHSTFGGGNLMPDLVYDDNRLPITGVSELTAVANADGRLMAFTPNTAYVIQAEEIAGVIGFRFEDTVEVGVKDKQDIANVQGGVLVHTQHGIYITNGFETKSISEPIDDKIRDNYTTGRVYYNRFKHEVYYKPTDAEDLYRFRLLDSVWEHMDKTVTAETQELLEVS